MQASAVQLAEARRQAEEHDWRPRTCVWEITLACNLRCQHCGTRAGKSRRNELSTAQCLDVVTQLSHFGCELITLSGGEPTLRKDWDVVATEIAKRGIVVNMVTNGVYRDEEAADDVAARAVAAGLANLGVSIDGPERVHDWVRGEGTFARTMKAIERFTAAGIKVAVLTTVNRLNVSLLDEMRQIVLDAGAHQWRFQLGRPMGAMSDHADIVIPPERLLDLIPNIAKLKKAGGVHVKVADCIGYFGPHDKLLRGRGWRGRAECWRGCQAGMQVIGVEADGGVKGCLSLQAKWGDGDPFIEGNLRERSLDEIWHQPDAFAYNRAFTLDSLTGFCGECRYAQQCRGGSRCVSSSMSGVLTEDTYCYHRVASLSTIRRRRAAGTSAVAAAALVLSVGAGCGGSSRTPSDAAVDGAASADGGTDSGAVAPPYGVDPPDGGPDSGAVAPPYGVDPPDGGPDAGPDAGPPDGGPDSGAVAPPYGVDPPDGGPDSAIAPAYGVPGPDPDAG